MLQPDLLGIFIAPLEKARIDYAMGWRHKVELDEGIKLAYEDFVKMVGDKEKTKRF